MATKKDYEKGQRVTVVRKNHTYYGETGTVSQIYPNGIYVRFSDENLVGMAFSTIRPECEHEKFKLLEERTLSDGDVYRNYECLACGKRHSEVKPF